MGAYLLGTLLNREDYYDRRNHHHRQKISNVCVGHQFEALQGGDDEVVSSFGEESEEGLGVFILNVSYKISQKKLKNQLISQNDPFSLKLRSVVELIEW